MPNRAAFPDGKGPEWQRNRAGTLQNIFLASDCFEEPFFLSKKLSG
jgi:hypothetical protein